MQFRHRASHQAEISVKELLMYKIGFSLKIRRQKMTDSCEWKAPAYAAHSQVSSAPPPSVRRSAVRRVYLFC